VSSLTRSPATYTQLLSMKAWSWTSTFLPRSRSNDWVKNTWLVAGLVPPSVASAASVPGSSTEKVSCLIVRFSDMMPRPAATARMASTRVPKYAGARWWR
jgi:hypothetical protein